MIVVLLCKCVQNSAKLTHGDWSSQYIEMFYVHPSLFCINLLILDIWKFFRYTAYLLPNYTLFFAKHILKGKMLVVLLSSRSWNFFWHFWTIIRAIETITITAAMIPTNVIIKIFGGQPWIVWVVSMSKATYRLISIYLAFYE